MEKFPERNPGRSWKQNEAIQKIVWGVVRIFVWQQCQKFFSLYDSWAFGRTKKKNSEKFLGD